MPLFLHGAKGNFQKEAALAPSPHSLTFLSQNGDWIKPGKHRDNILLKKEPCWTSFVMNWMADGYVRPFTTRQKSQPAYEGSVAFNCYTSVKPVVEAAATAQWQVQLPFQRLAACADRLLPFVAFACAALAAPGTQSTCMRTNHVFSCIFIIALSRMRSIEVF